MIGFRFGIYTVSWVVFSSIALFDCGINEAPAKVNIKLEVSKLNSEWIKDSTYTICVDKGPERCFWPHTGVLTWEGDQYKSISVEVITSNMATELTLDIKFERTGKKIRYSRKTISLLKYKSKTSFELHSIDLESVITVTIEYECEINYYPPRQCTKSCYPRPSESDCDGFGNVICKNGLQYDAKLDRCIGGNCVNVLCGNGRCISKPISFECVCLESYYGENCELQNPCYPNPCLHGGACNPDPKARSFKCACLLPFTGNKCDTKIPENTKSPAQIPKCKYPKSDDTEPCLPDNDESYSKRISIIPSIKVDTSDRSKRGGLITRKKTDWNHVSMTTTIVAAVGCTMFLLCCFVSIYVCYYSRGRKPNNRVRRVNNSPGAHYSDIPTNFAESSFVRSQSLDNNSAYMPNTCQLLQTLPNTMTMSSTGYSLQSNSYQENPQSILRQNSGTVRYVCQPNHPITPITLPKNYPKGSLRSIGSGLSGSTPPALPPRSPDTEIPPFVGLPQKQ